MQGNEDHKRYNFGDFTLDIGRSTLLRGDEEIKLRPQSFDVLKYLIENSGELVTRDVLHNEIWGSRAVTDDSLAQCVVEVRRALGDADRTLIRTVPRRGYLFEGVVTTEDAAANDSVTRPSLVLSRRAMAVAVLGIAIVLAWSVWLSTPDSRSIAVLPFMDLSVDKDLQHVGDGLAEDILNTLAHHPDLNVIARTSSFAYSSDLTDIESIGRALNVAYVLEGSVRREGDRFRVVAQLIDADDSTHVWSEAFETSFVDLPQVHEQISRSVWREIAPDTEVDSEPAMQVGISASEQMMLARQYEVRVRETPEVNPVILSRAIELYRDATETSPDSAMAFAGLARVLLFQSDLDGARLAIESAILINSDVSEVQDVLARYRWISGIPGAGDAWKRAVELNPGSVDALGSYGYWLWMQGSFDEASDHLYAAKEKDPASLSRYADLGNFLGNETRIDEVNTLIAEIQGRFGSAESFRVIARLLELIGRVDESIAWLLRARDQQPDDPTYVWALAELFVDIGDFETALALEPDPSLGLLLKMGEYEEFIDRAEMKVIEEPGDITLRYLLAFAQNVVGESRQAVWLLDRARVLDMVRPEMRSMWDLEAVYTWVDANAELGNLSVIQDTVHWIENYEHTQSANWWRAVYYACMKAAIGDDVVVFAELNLLSNSPRLPFLYLVRDARCFQRLHGDLRYEAVLDNIEMRQAMLRDRLPATLAEFGVSLEQMQR